MEFNQPVYAGFWLRFGACLIDRLIMGVVETIISIPILLFSGFFQFINMAGSDVYYTAWGEENHYYNDNFWEFFAMMIGFLVISLIVSTIVNWLYFAIMESSSKQGTLGKMALNIKVTDEQGNRISFARATGRYFGKFLSTFLLMFGYIMAGFTKRKQALHDILSGCLVVKNIVTIEELKMKYNIYNSSNQTEQNPFQQ